MHAIKKVGDVIQYGGEVMIVAERSLRSKFEEEISRHCKIKINGSINQYASGPSSTILPTEIRTTSGGGFFMNQEKFINDLLNT